MGSFRSHRRKIGSLPLTRQGLANFITLEQKKITRLLQMQTVFFLSMAAVIFSVAAYILTLNFYAAPVSVSKRSWVLVRNLTPVVAVKAHVDGVLDHIFVSQGQLVQKGELLGAVQTVSIKLDYEEARQDFAGKIVELHCLVSLQSGKSNFKLPINAQILIDRMARLSDVSNRVEQCDKELLRNLIADQSLEELVASLEDQFRILEKIVQIRGNIIDPLNQDTVDPPEIDKEIVFPFGEDQVALRNAYRDRLFPMIQLAQVQQKLQETRKEYFLRKLQKADELKMAIKQTTQDMRYLDKRIRELKRQLDDNFIYASISGRIIAMPFAKPGAYIDKNEAVFKLQPIENEFQMSISLDDEDSNRFAVGTPTVISLEKNQHKLGQISAKTVAVVRKPSGQLEAILDLSGNSKQNAYVILASGYKGEGEQRLAANVTTGQSSVWQSIREIVFGVAPKPAI